MKTSKIITLVLVYLCLPLMLKAQESEADRIQKDITVAENVLFELIKSPFKSIYSLRLNSLNIKDSFIKGVYKKDDNLTFNIIGFNPTTQRNFTNKDYPKKLIIKDDKVRITYQNGKKETLTREAYEDSLKVSHRDNASAFTHLFLSKYAHLLIQIPSINSIKFVYQKQSKPFLISRQAIAKVESNETTIIEISKENLNLYISEEISQEALEQKLKTSTKKDESMDEKSFETALSILRKNIAKYLDKDENFIASRKIDYISGMGVMYIIWGDGYVIHFTEKRLLSSTRIYDQFHSNNSQEEKQEQGISYTDFKQKLMSDLIEYGRTLNSLKEDEQVILRFPKFNLMNSFEEAPIYLELSVQKSILSQYNKREISLEKAIESIKVIEY